MRPRIAQRALMGVAVLGALLLATGCNNPLDPPAATVGDARISRSDVLDEANQWAQVEDEDLNGVDTKNAVDGELVSAVLSGQIAAEIYRSQAERMGLDLDDAAIADARAELESSPSAANYPEDLLDEIARRNATRRAVEQHRATQQWWTDADVEQYHKLTSERVCVRHILVRDEGEADDIVAQLREGADFAELAEDASEDRASASDGGNLGCQPRNAFVGAFNEAVEDADSGELLGPVRSPIGVHVILVDEAFHTISLEDAREEIESSFADPQGSGWAQFVLKTTKVNVDPRFGSWDPSSGQVVPPQGARPASSAGTRAVS